MENKGSLRFNELKSKVEKAWKSSTISKEDIALLREECESFIDGVILTGINSYNSRFQAYCAYASVLNPVYIKGSGATMFVAYSDGKISLNIDSIYVMLNTENEEQIMFILAHEVKHLLDGHLLKYNVLYVDDVTGLFLNMATDVDVNEKLRLEINSIFHSEAASLLGEGMRSNVPKNILTIPSVAKMLGMEIQNLRDTFNRIQRRGIAKKEAQTFSDYLYRAFDNRCKELLGYYISEILYLVTINRTTFNDQIFKVIDGDDSHIFNISNMKEAVSFCNDIARYLMRNITSYTKVSGGGKIGGSLGGEGEANSPDDSSENGSGGKEGSIKDFKSARQKSAVSISDLDEFVEAVSEAVSTGSTLIENMSRGRSATGSGMSDSVQLVMYESAVPWQAVLRQRLNTLSSIKEPTKKRINRRQPNRLELSGRKNKRTMSIAVAIDESGSISNAEYNYFISEMGSIASQFDCDIHFYEFTSEVESYTYIKSKDMKKELKSDDSVFKSRFCGGTAFQPVFDHLDSDRNFKPRESMVIMFTDGEGESKVDFRGIDNRLWVVVGSGSELSVVNESANNVFNVVKTRKLG